MMFPEFQQSKICGFVITVNIRFFFFFVFLYVGVSAIQTETTLSFCSNGINNEKPLKNKIVCASLIPSSRYANENEFFFSSLHAPNRSALHRASFNFYLVKSKKKKSFPLIPRLFLNTMHCFFCLFFFFFFGMFHIPSANYPSSHHAKLNCNNLQGG